MAVNWAVVWAIVAAVEAPLVVVGVSYARPFCAAVKRSFEDSVEQRLVLLDWERRRRSGA